MNKSAIVFRKIAAILLILALALALAGTILMFCAEETVGYSYYYSYRTRTVAYPEAGALPAVGTVILIVGLVLIFVSKKKPNAAIGTMVSIFVSQAFLLSSVALIDSYRISDEAWVGYWILLGASCLMAIAFILALLYLIFVKKPSGAKGADRPQNSYQKRLYQAAEVLRELKDLYDNGIFTQAEYIRAKREVIERFEVYPIKETPAHPPQQ